MKPHLFISYSRREVGFVDDLVEKLEKEGYDVWLDYRALVPGTPWKEQIDKGLSEADTVLLVVSKASLASEYVAMEWRHFLETNKRFILLIFEAVDLPQELEKFEWVDFRGSYSAGLNELFSQLKQPIQEEHPVPETGFKAPSIVWGAIAVSAIVAFLSLSQAWTIFIPWYLAPLPYQIYKRKFNFTQVQTALWALPIASFLMLIVVNDPTMDGLLWTGLTFGLLLLFILRSPAMQRWGKPEAIIPKYIRPQKMERKHPEPVSFYVDYARQDRVVAEDLIDRLKQYGHPQADKIEDAKAVFVLISKFKADSEAAPEKQMVFPVMIQLNNNIAPKLSRIQWIDFRPGVRGLDTIAQLLPNPKELMRALGMRPVSTQTVYPPVITAIYFFVLFLVLIVIGSSLDYISTPMLSYVSQETYDMVANNLLISLLIFAGLAFFILRGLTSRSGLFSSFRSIVVGVVLIGILILNIGSVDTAVLAELESTGYEYSDFNFIMMAYFIYFWGLIAIGFTIYRNRKDIARWFPARK